ncbi:hypothetical protein L211DRAFT_851625 [Terfezia boudieri ATCC MYA-4762]|uniref:Uncharacterized protein n=1 Tax=Terfezia boudieri ATCC MYA-4762 TaxID=1051890 RepID=A0A3N4LKT1_9PEZI|nr:hypothetical protein L211DRAFT_851625 [Terfezia boudieri ATCC MYA-4762]
MKIDYHDGDAGPTAGALAVIGGSVAEQKKPPTAEATRFLSHAVAAALKYRYTVLLPAGLALFTTTPIYSHLRATAAPPPGPLLPRNAKLEFTLLRYLTPILLLFLALLIPARTRTQRWLVSGVFAPAIFYLHWANLSYGCMNRVFGFVLATKRWTSSYSPVLAPPSPAYPSSSSAIMLSPASQTSPRNTSTPTLPPSAGASPGSLSSSPPCASSGGTPRTPNPPPPRTSFAPAHPPPSPGPDS